MSSISASDRSRTTDEVRRAREDYENRETEATKKHRREVKRLSQSHEKEVQELKDYFKEQIDSVRVKSSEAMSKREQEHIAKTEKLRSMYAQQLQNKLKEQETSREINRENYETSISKERQIHNLQREVLKSKFDDSLKEKDRQYVDLASRSKDEMKKTLEDRSNRLQEKHKVEKNVLIQGMDEKTEGYSRNSSEMRKSFENRLADQKRAHELEKGRLNTSWKAGYLEQEKMNNSLVNGKEKVLQSENRRLQTKYNNALQERLEALNRAESSLKEKAVDRIDREVRAAESDKLRIQNDRIIDMITNRRIRDLEKDNLINQYEDRMQGLYREREGFKESVLQVADERVDKAIKTNEELSRNTNSDYKLKANLTEMRNREDRDQLLSMHKQTTEGLKTQTEQRVDKMLKATADAQQNQEKMHKEHIGQLKNMYVDTLSEQRIKNLEQMRDQYQRMDTRLKETEKKSYERAKNLVDGYEQKLSALETHYREQLDQVQKSANEKIKQREKSHVLEQKSQELKFESKIAQIQEDHDKDLQRLERRHQEQMAALASKVNYYKQKA